MYLDDALPLSGSEPTYSKPSKWDTQAGVRSNNCYNYAFDNYASRRKNKTVPGDRSGYRHDISYSSCPPLKKRLLDDNKGMIYEEHPTIPCKEGFYKTMMFVSSKEEDGYGDFHFYRQNKDVVYEVRKGDSSASIAMNFAVPEYNIVRANGGSKVVVPGKKLLIENANVFSHKLGWATGGLITDSCGKIIKDPRKACRDHALSYDLFCGSYCVKTRPEKNVRNKVKV